MRPNVGAGAGPMDIRNIDPRDPRAPGSVDMRMMDSREQMQGNVRGVTGRLNGSTDMWQHGGMNAAHGQVPGMNKIVGPGAAAVNNPQWPGSQVGPKDIDMNKPGWGDASPPAARRPMGAEDGTSLWGSQGGRNQGVESSWKGVQDPRNNFGRNPIGAGNVGNAGPGFPSNRIPGAGMKPEGKERNISKLNSVTNNLFRFKEPHGVVCIQLEAPATHGTIHIRQTGKTSLTWAQVELLLGMKVQMLTQCGTRISHHGLTTTSATNGLNRTNWATHRAKSFAAQSNSESWLTAASRKTTLKSPYAAQT